MSPKQRLSPTRKLRQSPTGNDRDPAIKAMASASNCFSTNAMSMTTNHLQKYSNIGVAVDTENGLWFRSTWKEDLAAADELSTTFSAPATASHARRCAEVPSSQIWAASAAPAYPDCQLPEVAILGFPAPNRIEFDRRRGFRSCSVSRMTTVSSTGRTARFLKWITDAIEQPFLMELEGK